MNHLYVMIFSDRCEFFAMGHLFLDAIAINQHGWSFVLLMAQLAQDPHEGRDTNAASNERDARFGMIRDDEVAVGSVDIGPCAGDDLADSPREIAELLDHELEAAPGRWG